VPSDFGDDRLADGDARGVAVSAGSMYKLTAISDAILLPVGEDVGVKEHTVDESVIRPRRQITRTRAAAAPA